MDPCDNCKKRQGCTERCFPKKDYDRGKRNKLKKTEENKWQNAAPVRQR